MDLVGVVPAAGRATRLGSLPCSKEIYPVAFGGDPPRPVTPCERLLEQIRLAGASQAYVVIGAGKWDIPNYLDDGGRLGLDVAYLTIRDSPGAPFTVDRARPFVGDRLVALGFPDILLEPEDAFVHLRRRCEESGADVVLGLWPANRPAKVDMVEEGPGGIVRRVVIKPASTELTRAWLAAVWRPPFTRFLHERLTTHDGAARRDEVYVGAIVDAALAAGLRVESVAFDEGRYLDIGTPEDLLTTNRERR